MKLLVYFGCFVAFNLAWNLLDKETIRTTITLFCLTETKILQQLTKIRNNVKRLQQQLEDVKHTSECKLCKQILKHFPS